ncbi:unnamed protein product, partial [Prorocentrum cordatum]
MSKRARRSSQRATSARTISTSVPRAASRVGACSPRGRQRQRCHPEVGGAACLPGESVVKEYSKGGSFGELALLYLVPRAATVTAKEDSSVWVIDRTNFKKELMKVSNNKIAEYMKYLDHVEVLHSLLTEEKEAVAKALVEMHFSKGDIVLQQGEKGNT